MRDQVPVSRSALLAVAHVASASAASLVHLLASSYAYPSLVSIGTKAEGSRDNEVGYMLACKHGEDGLRSLRMLKRVAGYWHGAWHASREERQSSNDKLGSGSHRGGVQRETRRCGRARYMGGRECCQRSESVPLPESRSMRTILSYEIGGDG